MTWSPRTHSMAESTVRFESFFFCFERTLKTKSRVCSNKGVCQVRKNKETVQNDTLASKMPHLSE